MLREKWEDNNNETETGSNNSEFTDIWYDTQNENQQRLYALRLEYLGDLYVQYRENIRNVREIKSAAFHIYDQFIADNSLHTINISADCRDKLKDNIYRINTRNYSSDDAGLEQIITELLVMFNESIIEIWWLMDSVYRFQYLNTFKAGNDDNNDVEMVKPELDVISSNSVNY